MNTKKFLAVFVLTSVFFAVGDVVAQSFTDYIPAGFHTPFLKQGEFILSGEIFHFDNKRTSVGKADIFTNQSDKFLQTNIQLNGFLALTDKFTIGYSLFISPRQTTFSGNREIDSNFHVSPNFTIAFRLSNNFELFGVGSYDMRKEILGDTQYMQFVPVGRDSTTGETIYEERQTIIPATYDLEYRDFSLRAGFVWRGRF